MSSIIDLSGKTILVTGASSGIGKGVAERLSRLGAKLVLVARGEDRLKKTLACLDSDGHRFYPFDLSRVSEIEGLMAAICADGPRLDGVVHSAGLAYTIPLNSSTYDRVKETFDLNFFAFYELVRVFAKKRYNNGGGSIVGISSAAAVRPNMGKSAYASSKAAMDGAARAAANELIKKGIRINTVQPCFIETEMMSEYIKAAGEEAAGKQLPVIGKPLDVANVVAFLLSDAASFITGANIILDKGSSLL